MRMIRTGFEFRMSLSCNEERMRRDFNPLNNMLIRRESNRNKSSLPESLTIIVIDFITMTMTLGDIFGSIELIRLRFRIEVAWISTKTPRSA